MSRDGLRMAWMILAASLVTGAAMGQDGEWTRSCRFAVKADGVLDGEAYEQRGTPDLLGRFGDGTWFLLQPAKRRTLQLPPGAVEPAGGARNVVLSGSLPAEGTQVSLTPAALAFDVTGRRIKVLPTPPLLGEVDVQDFLDLCPDYQDREQSYQPDREMVQRIAAADAHFKVEVFFGSWCPHCQEILPRLVKSLRMAGNNGLDVRWIGLPRGFSDEPEVKRRAVKGVPTIIVFDGDREVGRFSGTEPIPVEESLANLVVQG